MAFVDAQQYDEENVGGGFHGLLKLFTATLAAATAEEVKFGKFKLVNPDNAMIVFDETTTGAGTPDTTIDLLADGEGVNLEDVGGGNFVFAIIGEWTTKDPA